MTGYKTSESHSDQAISLLEQILLVTKPNTHFLILLSQKNSTFVQPPTPSGKITLFQVI